MFSKRESADGVDGVVAEQVREAVERLLPVLVAEQLAGLVAELVAEQVPRLVAEQVAALGMSQPAVQDAVPGTRNSGRARPSESSEGGPRWIREAREAVADYENQLSSIDFDPEAADTSSAMRGYHWTATETLGKVSGILDEAGEHDESRAVYAALGRGRNALIRLDAVRNGRPVPLEVLTAEELAGPPRPERDPHTADRFVWQGNGNADFSLDRPFPHRTAVYIGEGADENWDLTIKLMERTEKAVRQVEDRSIWPGYNAVVAVPPEVTHLKVEDIVEQDWTFRLINPDELPTLEDTTRAERGAVYHHTLGAVRATVQCLDSITISFYQLCDCTSHCTLKRHKEPRPVASTDGEARTEIVLPKESGILEVSTRKAWSIDIAP